MSLASTATVAATTIAIPFYGTGAPPTSVVAASIITNVPHDDANSYILSCTAAQLYDCNMPFSTGTYVFGDESFNTYNYAASSGGVTASQDCSTVRNPGDSPADPPATAICVENGAQIYTDKMGNVATTTGTVTNTYAGDQQVTIVEVPIAAAAVATGSASSTSGATIVGGAVSASSSTGSTVVGGAVSPSTGAASGSSNAIAAGTGSASALGSTTKGGIIGGSSPTASATHSSMGTGTASNGTASATGGSSSATNGAGRINGLGAGLAIAAFAVGLTASFL